MAFREEVFRPFGETVKNKRSFAVFALIHQLTGVLKFGRYLRSPAAPGWTEPSHRSSGASKHLVFLFDPDDLLRKRFAARIGALFLGEALTRRRLIATALVIAGLVALRI